MAVYASGPCLFRVFLSVAVPVIIIWQFKMFTHSLRLCVRVWDILRLTAIYFAGFIVWVFEIGCTLSSGTNLILLNYCRCISSKQITCFCALYPLFTVGMENCDLNFCFLDFFHGVCFFEVWSKFIIESFFFFSVLTKLVHFFFDS